MSAPFDDYRSLGWRVVAEGGVVRLPLLGGLAALAVPECWGSAMIAVLAGWDCRCPVVRVPAARPSWVFISDGDGVVVPEGGGPPGALVLNTHRCVLLPPTTVGGRAVGWMAEPDPLSRWLPTLAAVLSAARLVTSGGGHSLRHRRRSAA
ncbi:hypothetical protein [Umezawaea beigongshangensis]|uniref:hypothetical protein n=1 Tax=Umezawaea beigongshangensis TaxID=2780383 RepID=UPI0018F1B394|nr:hypothetical protein [Umezawaea beigongshangensis]